MPSIAATSYGGFVIAWIESEGLARTVHMEGFHSNGNSSGLHTFVDLPGDHQTSDVSIAATADDRIVLSAVDTGQTSTNTFVGIYDFRPFTYAGDPNKADLIYAKQGASTVLGGGGADTLVSVGGADSLTGGADDDMLISYDGASTLDGGARLRLGFL